ncbi:RHS repeat-associated core domain-containing protein [Stigmatella aurantiaca]|nr:RHS repeat-associated core domain-containing protein [Stigmatella aurantiaca]
MTCNYEGVTVAGYEYRRFQTGAQPFWTPLRFPGQYYDEETDLFENWNRYYDPSIGRYLQAEPLLHQPWYIVTAIGRALRVPTYAYALNDPLGFVDENGLQAVDSMTAICARNPAYCNLLTAGGGAAGAAGGWCCGRQCWISMRILWSFLL